MVTISTWAIYPDLDGLSQTRFFGRTELSCVGGSLSEGSLLVSGRGTQTPRMHDHCKEFREMGMCAGVMRSCSRDQSFQFRTLA